LLLRNTGNELPVPPTAHTHSEAAHVHSEAAHVHVPPTKPALHIRSVLIAIGIAIGIGIAIAIANGIAIAIGIAIDFDFDFDSDSDPDSDSDLRIGESTEICRFSRHDVKLLTCGWIGLPDAGIVGRGFAACATYWCDNGTLIANILIVRFYVR
jgi:hypothetical protein